MQYFTKNQFCKCTHVPVYPCTQVFCIFAPQLGKFCAPIRLRKKLQKNLFFVWWFHRNFVPL